MFSTCLSLGKTVWGRTLYKRANNPNQTSENIDIELRIKLKNTAGKTYKVEIVINLVAIRM